MTDENDDPENDDPLLKSLLEETLGGVQPPELTGRVLERWAARGAAAPVSGEVRPAGLKVPRRRGPAQVGALVFFSGIGTIAAGALIAWTLGWLSPDEQPPAVARRSERPKLHQPVKQPAPASPIVSPAPKDAPKSPMDTPRPAVVEAPKPEPSSPTAKNTDKPPDKPPVGPDTRPPGATDDEMIAFIDQELREDWQAAGVRPSDKAPDAEWCRRVFLAVIGRIPTVRELDRFVADRSPGKRDALVEQLLTASDYSEEYARSWTSIWASALVGRTGGADDLVDREGLEQYLRRALLENKPYDRIVAELIAASGSTKPGAENFNGAANFLVAKLDADAVQATARTAQVFLGVQIQCVQCHNHPFNDWKQERFWSLNAFFRQSRALRSKADDATSVQLIDEDFAGEGDGDASQAEIYYEQPNGILKAAYPVFLDGTRIDPSGHVADVNRRRELARLVTASPLMAEAAVNRLWAHFFGHGFTRPVDDAGPHNPPSHPEMLQRLSREFAARRYDVKALVRWLVRSEAYGLTSRPNASNTNDEPARGLRPLFSRYYLRPLRAEQLYDSLVVAADADRAIGDFAERQRRKTAWLREYTLAYGTDECDECSLLDGSFVQTLMMMNGELTSRATDSDQPNFLNRVVRADTPGAQKIRQLFLAAVARPPTGDELRVAQQLFTVRRPPAEALEDVWWALLNSSEFVSDR
ncbi:MAG: DUF1549 domain-containing protein [Pirellulales bacterium]